MTADVEGWLISLDDTAGYRWDDARCRADLSPEETRRAARFARAPASVSYVRGRSAVRRVLGSALGRRPRDVRIAVDPGGGPTLPDHPDHSASWSRTADVLLVAVGPVPRIGVDVEVIRRVGSPARVLGTCYPSVDALGDLGDPEAFFSAWTLLEASVKATGLGLARGARHVRLGRPPGSTRCVLAGVRDTGAFAWSGGTDRVSAPREGVEVMAAVVTGRSDAGALARSPGRRVGDGDAPSGGRPAGDHAGADRATGRSPLRLRLWQRPPDLCRPRASGPRATSPPPVAVRGTDR
ncbi:MULTISPECIES: 4'-phosphopantetheinyl transferase family protein [unclassified Streptomyces]|uniref:4'-phosphopantetheinyl transferase family protein n=1 Tax=unclassified Streptomyces TaxID=2593676 RepID=UPI001905F423|nr:4'-phosphopantetheinyl transferase superfamily protein [Streptomyces sp. HSG2]